MLNSYEKVLKERQEDAYLRFNAYRYGPDIGNGNFEEYANMLEVKVEDAELLFKRLKMNLPVITHRPALLSGLDSLEVHFAMYAEGALLKLMEDCGAQIELACAQTKLTPSEFLRMMTRRNLSMDEMRQRFGNVKPRRVHQSNAIGRAMAGAV